MRQHLNSVIGEEMAYIILVNSGIRSMENVESVEGQRTLITKGVELFRALWKAGWNLGLFIFIS